MTRNRTVRLLDVNVLLALMDAAHRHHELASRWFLANAAHAWATCALTENGMIRVASGHAYPNLRLSPEQAAESLRRFKDAHPKTHVFWPASISLTEGKIFDLSAITGSKQTTDAYLAGLAFHHGGRLATLDAQIPWRAVRGATEDLVDRIG